MLLQSFDAMIQKYGFYRAQRDNNHLYVISPILFETGNDNLNPISKSKIETQNYANALADLHDIENKIGNKLVKASIGLEDGSSSTNIIQTTL